MEHSFESTRRIENQEQQPNGTNRKMKNKTFFFRIWKKKILIIFCVYSLSRLITSYSLSFFCTPTQLILGSSFSISQWNSWLCIKNLSRITVTIHYSFLSFLLSLSSSSFPRSSAYALSSREWNMMDNFFIVTLKWLCLAPCRHTSTVSLNER